MPTLIGGLQQDLRHVGDADRESSASIDDVVASDSQ